MPFQFGNQEWRKRKVNRGGRPTREQAEKKRLEQEALNRKIEEWAEDYAAMIFMKIMGKKLYHKIVAAGY